MCIRICGHLYIIFNTKELYHFLNNAKIKNITVIIFLIFYGICFCLKTNNTKSIKSIIKIALIGIINLICVIISEKNSITKLIRKINNN